MSRDLLKKPMGKMAFLSVSIVIDKSAGSDDLDAALVPVGMNFRILPEDGLTRLKSFVGIGFG